ncbi:MAG TPA: glycerate kinase [Chthoniobacterales bacterium]|nr:glycerate kinase [Chthoniobacterales bacterium]
MKFLVAPDKFKGSLSAQEVAENIARGIRDVFQDTEIKIASMADGGEGTAEAIYNVRGGKWVICSAHGPLGDPIEASYVWLGKSAVIEMSEAAGMRRLKNTVGDVLRANTFGVGEMLRDAAKRGAREIIIGLGGSATNDGGLGMARALGFRFLGEAKSELTDVASLVKLTRIVPPSPQFSPLGRGKCEAVGGGHFSQVFDVVWSSRIIAAVDVKNPLLGRNGATRTFGPQKGATPEQLEILERSLTHLADTVTRDLACDFRNEPGAGAAGGLGFGLMSFCDAKVRPGFEVVAEAVELEQKIKGADVIITGEGKLDNQTLEGKTPAGVADLGRRLGKRVFAIVGCAEANSKARDLFDGVYELAGPIPEAKELLRERARELATALKS